MKPLSKLHQEAVLKAKTEQERVKAAANAMIETPMEMIRAILMKHEQAVIEVMSDLAKERDRARELLERCETEMRYAMWGVELKDNVGRNDILRDVQDFLK
jgi:hypothetical protein